MALFVTEGDQLGERLKQQLTDMLEFAEEELQCDRVLLGVSRRRQDKDALLKTLLFLGFAGYNPGRRSGRASRQATSLTWFIRLRTE
ncbi:hypothetical protein BOX15_Mlig004369g3 [Macrostomum lignano]|uniref:Ornithine decarboxylase antizyme n=2 Tax=Macrostomum lignano TaxID=282301 RepID=A0A1I8JCJ4_9PLAT|nr:hypothetical protein BOX15_Mlig004369g3 [Macrostomum lignano]